MKKLFYLILLIIISLNTKSFTKENNCKDFKKFSTEHFKCKADLVKNKTISAGKNLIKDTKEYQKEEWTEEKKKILKTKKKIIK